MEWLAQIGLFIVMFAIPCAVFLVSTIIASELRDFFESSALGFVTHLLLSVMFSLALYRFVHAVITPDQAAYLGLIIDIECALIAGALVLGANGCMYGDQAPSKRIGPRGIKRYR